MTKRRSQKAMGLKRKSSDQNGDGVMGDLRNILDRLKKMLKPRDLQKVQKIFQKYDKNAPELSSRECKYRFQFKNEFSDILYTDTNFKAEIFLVDASNNVISSDPMAAGKIEIVVLKGDIDVDENGEWTEEQFKNFELKPRKDKGPLLIGNLPSRLCDGSACISDVRFTDNSSWTKTKKFRLGVRGIDKQVQEGISKDFRVLDRHMKGLQKDHPPSMNDEVYRLKGISENGALHNKLKACQIYTVCDFLYFCAEFGQETLRNKIEMKEGHWKKTYGQALQSRQLSDIRLDCRLVNHPALPNKNLCALDGSSSSQNVPMQPYVMFPSARGLAASIGPEPECRSILFRNPGVLEITEQNSLTPERLLDDYDYVLESSELNQHNSSTTNQNLCELNGSSSSQNVPVQHYGMFPSTQGLAALIGSESRNGMGSSFYQNSNIPFELLVPDDFQRIRQPDNFENFL